MSLNKEIKTGRYLDFLELPLKIVACWDLLHKNNTKYFQMINKIYLVFVIFILSYVSFALGTHLYETWTDIMSSLDKISDSLPLLVSLAIIVYYAIYRKDFYLLLERIDKDFKYNSARGLTNMNMFESCKAARKFWIIYTVCTMFSVTMYAVMPVVVHLWTKQPMQSWILNDINKSSILEFVFAFLVSCLSQLYVGLAMGQFVSSNGHRLATHYVGPTQLLAKLLTSEPCAQVASGVSDVTDRNLSNKNNRVIGLARSIEISASAALVTTGVFFASNSILICGQLDLLCCSLRNSKYTSLLQDGVKHSALVNSHADIQNDEEHNYSYNCAEIMESLYHYDEMAVNAANAKTQFEIYSTEYDTATITALRECASMSRAVKRYIVMFEEFVSPLLVLRVVQVTMYLCTLLYTATLKFEMTTVEYLAAVALDIFVYCYYGNQIILQADRVSTAAYQSAWHTMGVRPRRVLLNILLANKRSTVIRAGKFLPMDLHTFVLIIKTSFSYYTLLVNVNEN